MAGTRPRITDVIIDSHDPERLAAFWSTLLDRPVGARIGPYVFLERADGPGVGFQQVGTPKTGKNRVHVDVSSPDPVAEVARIEALGGHRLGEYADGGFLVMSDPEGNEFCVIPDGGCDLDDEGRAHYLPAPPPPELRPGPAQGRRRQTSVYRQNSRRRSRAPGNAR